MKGPTKDKARAAQRFRRSLPTERRQPAVASVLGDIVALAKREVDALMAKGAGLSPTDIRKLESLVKTIESANKLEERILAALGADLAGASDERLTRLATGEGDGNDEG